MTTWAGIAKGFSSVPNWLKEFVKYANSLDIKDVKEETLLHYFVLCGKTECIEYLLEAGANPNIQNKYGDTPLALVVMLWERDSNFDKVVSKLLEFGATPLVENKNGVDCYDYADLHSLRLFNKYSRFF